MRSVQNNSRSGILCYNIYHAMSLIGKAEMEVIMSEQSQITKKEWQELTWCFYNVAAVQNTKDLFDRRGRLGSIPPCWTPPSCFDGLWKLSTMRDVVHICQDWAWSRETGNDLRFWTGGSLTWGGAILMASCTLYMLEKVSCHIYRHNFMMHQQYCDKDSSRLHLDATSFVLIFFRLWYTLLFRMSRCESEQHRSQLYTGMVHDTSNLQETSPINHVVAHRAESWAT